MRSRVPGRLAHRPAATATIALLGTSLLWPASALAATKVRLEYDLQQDGVVDCGPFVDNFTDFYHVREVDELDPSGNVVKVIYHAEHHSIDTNPVTGVSLQEHGHFYEVDDYVKGTYTLTGAQEVANRPGRGVVIQDTGRIVLDADFEMIFFAGGRNHSQGLSGDQVWCDALS